MATGVARPTLAISTATAFDFSSSNYTYNSNASMHLQEAADALPPMPRTVSAQLPTPPMAYAPPPPKLRIRSEGLAARRLAKRQQQEQSTVPASSSSPKRAREEDDEQIDEPTTPKRARIAPEQLPLGLERLDFHNAQDDTTIDACGEWTEEDDRVLVEVVLEKLRLTKNEWAECARSIGKGDKNDVARRWKSLMLGGEVGIKKRARSRMTSTWR